MKPTFVLLALVLAIPAVADTISPCVPDTAANYIAQGACTEDPFILKNFAWNGTFGTVVVTPEQVDLIPPSGAIGLSFQGAPGPNPFSVSGTQTITAVFDYTIDPRPPIINGATLTLSPTGSAAPTRSGVFASTAGVPFADLTALVCVGDTFSADACKNGIEPPLVLTVDTRTSLQASVDFAQPVSVVDFIITLKMQANGGSISIIGGGTTAETIPEPGSAALALSGMGALLALAYRRSRA